MTYPPDPNNPYGQPQQGPYGAPPQNPYGQQPPMYGYPQQQPPAPNYGYPQQAGYGVPQQAGYGVPQQAGYGYAPMAPMAPPVLASWGSRVGASIVDFLVVGVPALVGYIVLIAMAAGSTHQTCDSYGYCYSTTDSSAVGGGAMIMLLGFAISLGLGIWQLVKEGSTGQTTGKKALGIRLVREQDGQPLGFGMAFVRRLAHFLDGAVCYLGYLWPLWDDKSQTFADKVCNSLVIRA
ncbi:hypothetical protein C7C46_17425 [Streptomyces tateyamensis]|uniref:RDD domain-containing protein n=1 Tax=Streptomyces tateyamensis TaxID=565073 RepID=A0A2V4ND75_9ACTN|nr:RDD family protein [Streptomyces tateyamensis]PYC78109.1 hypothetical protein C7C46_17425 [Streptomyces tateyamensis]